MSAETAIQGGLFTALSASSPVMALVAGIHDFAPQVADSGSDAVFPYIEVGRVVLAEMDTKTRLGFDFVARIHTRSRSGSAKECKDIQGAIYDALHLQGITVTGYTTILLRRETSDTMRTPDGAFHGVCEYRGLIDKV